MAVDVPYTLTAVNGNAEFEWKVQPGVTIVRKRR